MTKTQKHPTWSDEAHVSEETVQNLPPSAKLVLKVLEFEGRLTQQGLAAETRLPQRTVRDATKYLVDAGLVEERPYFRDARQSMYRLQPETLPSQ